MEQTLTGKFRYRHTLFGKLVLQVQYEKRERGAFNDIWTSVHWRDAKLADMGTSIAELYRPNQTEGQNK